MLDSLAGWSQPERDAAYDNSAAVSDSSAQLAAYQRRSDLLASRAGGQLDIVYGQADRLRFDFFPAQPTAPTLLFIHGGYWQMRHKNTFRFVVEGALQHGINAALIGYTLAPQASLTRIDGEVRQGIAAVRAHAQQQGARGEILLSGWSAGGHLAAMAMDCPGVIAGLGISGIYDLRPLALTRLNGALQLSASEIDLLSPLRRAADAKPFVTAYGTAELPQLQAQSRRFSQYRAGLPGASVAVEGADHFSILEQLARQDGVLLRHILSAAAASGR